MNLINFFKKLNQLFLFIQNTNKTIQQTVKEIFKKFSIYNIEINLCFN